MTPDAKKFSEMMVANLADRADNPEAYERMDEFRDMVQSHHADPVVKGRTPLPRLKADGSLEEGTSEE